jgi:hypothetical protein
VAACLQNAKILFLTARGSVSRSNGAVKYALSSSKRLVGAKLLRVTGPRSNRSGVNEKKCFYFRRLNRYPHGQSNLDIPTP